MTSKVLIVDDEANVLTAIKRSLRKMEGVYTAQGGEQALQTMESDGPFAVVISDQQMPEMDGISFLKEVKSRAPNTVRLMLTGNADQKTAVDAVRESEIFRFLNKPCSHEDLTAAITAGRQQYQVLMAEKELLQNTLAGSVKLLVDVISLRDPKGFENTARLRAWVKKISATLKHTDAWKLDMVAMLWSIGQITLPVELAAKINGNQQLTVVEKELLDRTPEVARDLISNVPRLTQIGDAIYYQNRGFDGSGFPADGEAGEKIPLYGRMIKILKDLIETAETMDPTSLDFDKLEQKAHLYDPTLLQICRKCLASDSSTDKDGVIRTLVEVAVNQLQPGDVVATKILSAKGSLILSAGHELSDAAVHKLKQYVKLNDVIEPIQVLRIG